MVKFVIVKANVDNDGVGYEMMLFGSILIKVAPDAI